MASLTPKTPFDGLLPISQGTLTLSEACYDSITWVAPAKGKDAAISKALEKQIGASFPEPGKTSGAAVWTGPRQAMVLGETVKPIIGAALSDQSSAWACCVLAGPQAKDVLARLLPIDLCDTAFAVGDAARTLLGHMNCVVIRRGADRFEIMVFRSMAASAAHEIQRAMCMVSAREAAL